MFLLNHSREQGHRGNSQVLRGNRDFPTSKYWTWAPGEVKSVRRCNSCRNCSRHNVGYKPDIFPQGQNQIIVSCLDIIWLLLNTNFFISLKINENHYRSTKTKSVLYYLTYNDTFIIYCRNINEENRIVNVFSTQCLAGDLLWSYEINLNMDLICKDAYKLNKKIIVDAGLMIQTASCKTTNTALNAPCKIGFESDTVEHSFATQYVYE